MVATGVATIGLACGGGSETRVFRTEDGLILDSTCHAIADEVVVKFAGDEPRKDALGIIDRYMAERTRADLNLGGAWLLKVHPDRRDELKEALEKSSDVEYAELNGLVTTGLIDVCEGLTPTTYSP